MAKKVEILVLKDPKEQEGECRRSKLMQGFRGKYQDFDLDLTGSQCS